MSDNKSDRNAIEVAVANFTEVYNAGNLVVLR
jgi:hypothetical protein